MEEETKANTDQTRGCSQTETENEDEEEKQQMIQNEKMYEQACEIMKESSQPIEESVNFVMTDKPVVNALKIQIMNEHREHKKKVKSLEAVLQHIQASPSDGSQSLKAFFEHDMVAKELAEIIESLQKAFPVKKPNAMCQISLALQKIPQTSKYFEGKSLTTQLIQTDAMMQLIVFENVNGDRLVLNLLPIAAKSKKDKEKLYTVEIVVKSI